MGVAAVGSRGTMTLVHGPVVGQAVDITVLRLIFRGGGLVHVAADVVEAQVVHVGRDATEVEVVVVGIVDGLHGLCRHRLVLEQVDIGGAILRQDVEGHGAGLVAQGEEYPLVLRQRGLADGFRAGNGGHHVSGVIDAQREMVRSSALLQDGAAVVPAEPEVHGEVATEEHGVHRAGTLAERHQFQCHLMIDRLLVELGGDDDVLVAHIAGHDVLVELHGQFVAVCEDAVGGRGCEEGAGLRHVLDDSDGVAVYMDKVGAVGCGGKATELVVTLGIREVARHVDGQPQVARGRQHVVGCVERVGAVGNPGVEVGPLRVAGKAVLHAHVLQVFELAVEVGQFQLQFARLIVGVQHWLGDSQVDSR